MTHDEIEKRVADLEADKVRRRMRAADDAFDRLWRVLNRGLCPDAPPFRRGDTGRCEVPLLVLDARLTAGTDTAIDRALLASLPADALAVWIDGGATARSFVAAYAKAFRDF